jgi:hypothetical protein
MWTYRAKVNTGGTIMYLRKVALGIGVLLAAAAMASAQQSITKMGDTIKASVTITGIDSTNRLITFKSDDGTEDTVKAGPDFTRFDELKVGDKVNLTYYESKVYRIRKPGDPPLELQKESAAVTGTSGTLPGATMSAQTVTTVTVKAVDMNVPSITVLTEDGRTVSRKVEDKANLANVQPGDKIDIVSTAALLVSVERQ